MSKLVLWQALFFEDNGRFFADVGCWSYPELNRLIPDVIGPANNYAELKELVIKTLYSLSPKYRLAVVDDFNKFNIYKGSNIE